MDWRRVLTNLIGFLPRVEGPLVVELIEYLRAHENLICVIDWGEWDFVGSGPDDDTPQIAIKSVRNSIPRDHISVLSRSLIPIKIILVEGHNPDVEALKAYAAIMASAGVGIYVRNYGWVSLPARVIPVTGDDVRFAQASAWRKDEDGIWLKRCGNCREEKTTADFPKRGRVFYRDPYKSICKACEALKKVERRARVRQKPPVPSVEGVELDLKGE